MANRNSGFPITINELLFIIAIFLVAFGGILGSIILFYLGLFILGVLVVQKFLKVIFNPVSSPKELFEFDY